eukprot:768475-Hanusia_phi.AAC.4
MCRVVDGEADGEDEVDDGDGVDSDVPEPHEPGDVHEHHGDVNDDEEGGEGMGDEQEGDSCHGRDGEAEEGEGVGERGEILGPLRHLGSYPLHNLHLRSRVGLGTWPSVEPALHLDVHPVYLDVSSCWVAGRAIAQGHLLGERLVLGEEELEERTEELGVLRAEGGRVDTVFCSPCLVKDDVLAIELVHRSLHRLLLDPTGELDVPLVGADESSEGGAGRSGQPVMEHVIEELRVPDLHRLQLVRPVHVLAAPQLRPGGLVGEVGGDEEELRAQLEVVDEGGEVAERVVESVPLPPHKRVHQACDLHHLLLRLARVQAVHVRLLPVVHQDVYLDPSCPELLVPDLEDFLQRVVAGHEVTEAEVLPKLGQAVGSDSEHAEEDEDDPDLDVEVGEERSVVFCDKVPQVSSLPHAAAVVAARLVHLLLLDVAADDAGGKNGDLKEVVQHDADGGVGAEVAQGRECGDGAQGEGEHVRQTRQRDRRSRALHHVCDPVLQLELLGGSIQRSCEHEHVVDADAEEDEGQQRRDGRLRDVGEPADAVSGADGEADGGDTREGDGAATEDGMKLAEHEDGVDDNEGDADVELDDVASYDSTQHPADRALHLHVGNDVLALLVPLVHLLEELSLPHQRRVASLLPLGVCDRVEAVAVLPVGVVDPRGEPGQLQRAGAGDASARVVNLPRQQLLAVRDVKHHRLLAPSWGEHQLGLVDPGQQLGVGVDEAEVEAMSIHVVHELERATAGEAEVVARTRLGADGGEVVTDIIDPNHEVAPEPRIEVVDLLEVLRRQDVAVRLALEEDRLHPKARSEHLSVQLLVFEHLGSRGGPEILCLRLLPCLRHPRNADRKDHKGQHEDRRWVLGDKPSPLLQLVSHSLVDGGRDVDKGVDDGACHLDLHQGTSVLSIQLAFNLLSVRRPGDCKQPQQSIASIMR